MTRVAVVTGGTSGIGLAVCRALSGNGMKVYALSRRHAKDAAYTHIVCDVSDEESCRSAVKGILAAEGHIDLLVNNAGFGISGAVEFTESKDARRLADVNLFGTDNMTRAVLPSMREAGTGKIICISSVAAPLAIPFQAWYSVTKAAVLAYAGALRNEVRPFGVQVCAVLPGDIRTGFTAAREKSAAGDDIYGGRIEKSVSRMENDEKNGMSPDVAGKLIAKLANRKNLKPQYTVGFSYKLFVLLARLLPCRFVMWGVGKLYGEWGKIK